MRAEALTYRQINALTEKSSLPGHSCSLLHSSLIATTTRPSEEALTTQSPL